MTTNVHSSSLANDKRESDDNQSSNEIRADIDQTRASVGEKIDQLQARLDPNKLKQQAQETVQEMLTDTANSMTDYVRTHKDEMVNSLADAARRNPLPTALVGLGVGWLILESMTGNKRRDDDRYEYERRNLRQSRGYEGSTGRSFVSQGRGQFMEEDYYSPEYYNDTNYGDADYGRSGFASNSEFASRPENEQRDQRYGNGHQQGSNPLAKAANAVKDTVSDVSGEIKERVEDMGQEIKERVGNMTGDVKDRVGGAVDDVRFRAERMADRVGDQRHQLSDQGQRQLNRAGYQMEEWQARARYEGQRRGKQVMNNLEDNPLTYGAVALAAGVALALLLPQTRTENRYFGEMRDQVMEKGKEVMESAKGQAQEVIAEVRPELEEKARQLVSDVKEVGKEVASSAASELKPIVDKAVEKGKEAATNVAQEAGVDPSKLTGNKPSSGAANLGSSGSGSSMGNKPASGTPASASPASASSTGGSSGSSTGASTTGQTSLETPVLNRDTLAGQWKQIKGEVKSKWGQLTDDDLTKAEGDYEKLVGSIQTRYGYTRERVERELNDWFKSRKA